MVLLAQRSHRPLGAGQRQALAVMGVDVYLRRRLPAAPAPAGSAPESWLQDVLARAIARGVYEATALPFPNALPAWRDKFGAKR